MSGLAKAIERLVEVAEGQLEEQRLANQRERRRDYERWRDDPELQANFLALKNPPRQFSALAMAKGCIAVYGPAFETVVPGEYFMRIDAYTIEVSCPCSSIHHVPDSGHSRKAPCGRYFLFDGTDLRVCRPTDVEEEDPTPVVD